MIDTIIKGIFEKKGHEIVCIDLSEIENAICSHFVICHGESNTQVNAIAASVEKETTEHLDIRPFSIEGMNNAEWVVLDYGDAVVHIFQQTVRLRYKLEELWGDGQITHVNEIDFRT
ncbi:MAG: ribosome silencing factor [Bacteroidales bacterium]|nr:ribosome silencing factor [Bacteroidales bacterium]